jgi:hypothetical protein
MKDSLIKRWYILLAAAILSASVFVPSGAAGAANPVPYPAALVNHPFAKQFNPSDLAGPAWNAPANDPGNCAPNPSQIHLNSSGYAELDTNGNTGNCTNSQSPHTYPTKDGYVYEAKIYVSTYANWPAFWMYGDNWPSQGEIDAMEINYGQNCVTWHYGTNASNQQPSTCFNGGLTPTAGVPNIKANAWNIVDIAFGGNRIEVFYNGKSYVTIPETLTNDTSDPMWITFSQGSCATSNGNVCVNGTQGIGTSGNLQIQYLRIFT